ncbi:MAG: hypothetical protein GY951_00590 [Psychromonas sp.]|nr:hypothetical protein [Psychromonas sp.]
MNIYLWKYQQKNRNYAGHHLSADAEGAEYLIELLGHLETTTKSKSKTVHLSPVTKKVLSVPGYNAPIVKYNEWKLELVTEAKDEYFEFDRNNSNCILKLSNAQAGCIMDGVKDISQGKGDYCIGGDKDNVIWFWWYLA